MADCNPCYTPVCTSTTLRSDDGSALADGILYRSILGALQFVTLTRLDLNFAVNRLSQFMHKPSEIHFHQLKQALWYLKYTYNYGLQLYKPSHLRLHAYSDVN